MNHRKKLIEIALPLEAINAESAREKSIRHGHPSTLHLWWSRKPTATARTVLFAQLVDDPSAWPELFPTPEAQERERERLLALIRRLAKWENSNDPEVLAQAREEIWSSWRRTCAAEGYEPSHLPAFHDPFAGGGAIPLEAQRLGLESYASDLNPVAVLINKGMLELPPRFAGRPPVNPQHRGGFLSNNQWLGACGLAEDVRYYGQWLCEEAKKRIGRFYPPVEVTAEMVEERPDLKPYLGQRLTPLAWLWVRTVRSPNPAFAHLQVPLAPSFVLSKKPGKEAYVEPVIEGDQYRFAVRVGRSPAEAESGTKLARGGNFRCLLSGAPIDAKHIKAEGQAGRMGGRLLAIVAEGRSGRVYLSPMQKQEEVAREAVPGWRPNMTISGSTQYLGVKPYGVDRFDQLFTPRQLLALTTFSGLVKEAILQVRTDALAAGMPDDGVGLEEGGSGATAYAQAVGVYLAFALGKAADYWSGVCIWHNSGEKIAHTFGRQAIPMTWDYAEANPLSSSSGSWANMLDWVWKALEALPARPSGQAFQQPAQELWTKGRVVSTDPPYYDNIPYADLSDFFYVWLRPTLQEVFPGLFATIATPKAEELVAAPYRHGSKEAAERFFLQGMEQALSRLAAQAHPAFPVSIYYAFKQAEQKTPEGLVSTGWETFLEAAIRAGFAITGTWPMRTELSNRMRARDANALASSIVLVCRPRPASAPTATRREFLSALREELPAALVALQKASIAPVDLAQAAIGPGMAIYSRYAQVLDAEGQPVRVREALALINQTLDGVLAEQEGEFEPESRWAITWFEKHGFAEGEYGEAESLSKAKNISIGGLAQRGILEAKRGRVRLLRPEELAGWDPDGQATVWEAVHRLSRALEQGGEEAAAGLAKRLLRQAEAARELAYRLFTLAERKGLANEAFHYNALVRSWPEITRLAQRSQEQARLLSEV